MNTFAKTNLCRRRSLYKPIFVWVNHPTNYMMPKSIKLAKIRRKAVASTGAGAGMGGQGPSQGVATLKERLFALMAKQVGVTVDDMFAMEKEVEEAATREKAAEAARAPGRRKEFVGKSKTDDIG